MNEPHHNGRINLVVGREIGHRTTIFILDSGVFTKACSTVHSVNELKVGMEIRVTHAHES
jgi:hypothetical protein